MKLIGPQTSQVQSLGRHQTGVTAEAGKAKAIETVTKGISDTLGTLAGASEDILATNTRRQQQQAELFMQKEDNDFWEQYGGKDFFDASEVPEEFRTEGMMVKGRVASAEVLPQMYQARIKEALPNASKIVENQKMRNDWLASTEETILGRQQVIQNQANSQIEKQIFVDQNINYNNAMDNDRPDVALRITQEMKGNPKIVEGLKDEARKGAETIRYERYMLEEEPNFEGVRDSIEFLSLDAEDYQNQVGQLNAGERLAWRNKLQGFLNSKKARNTAAKEADMRMLKREIKMVKANSENGASSSADADIDLLNRVESINDYYELIGEGRLLNVEEADLIDEIGFHGVNDTMLLQNRADRRKFIDDNNLRLEGFEADDLREKLRKSDAAQTSMENTNPMKAAANAGFFGDEGLVAIDFNAPAEDLVDALGARSDQFDRMQSNYGEGLGEGIFDKDDVPSHAAVINSKTTVEKAQIFASVNEQFGRDSIHIYKQLGIDGNAGAFAVAGSIAATNPSMSEMVLIGEEYAKTPQRDLSSLSSAMRPKMSEALGNMYGRDFQWGKATQEAIYYAYIGAAKDTTDLQNIDSAKGHLWFDKGIFEQVVDGVTGGTVEYGNIQLLSPAPGVDNDQMNTWAEGLSMDWLKSEGLPHKDAVNISKGLALKKLSLVPIKRGEYYLQDEHGYYMGDSKGGTFKLRYDPEMPIEYKGDYSSREQTDITKEYYGL